MNRLKTIINKIARKLLRLYRCYLNFISSLSDAIQYQRSLRQLKPNRQKDTKLAVIIHLYYTDNWSLFVKKLANLNNFKHDIFVTIPDKNIFFIKEIKAAYPSASIIIVPNRGRDVLPFVKVAGKLSKMGYEYVLKFHSKKSTHRDDGQEWLEAMLNKLLPDKKSVIDKTKSILADVNTGVIGPEGFYYPLTINFPANGEHMTTAVKKIYNNDIAYKYLQSNRGDYGFFGGTMFWVRLDAIDNLLHFPIYYFEAEHGQIDGTFPHALERLFGVIPEIENKINYEINSSMVLKRPYASDNIPDWSEDHLK